MKNRKTHILLLICLSFIGFIPIVNAQNAISKNGFFVQSGGTEVTYTTNLPNRKFYSLGTYRGSGLYGVALSPNWSVGLFIDTFGHVSINNSLQPNGDAMFSVNGSIATRGCVVTNEGWADYVFDPGYKLKPLCDVESFIEKNGHLPEIPSQAEIEKKGVDVAPIIKLQMQKIEELTLYLLQQQKKIDELEAKVSRLSTAPSPNVCTHR